MYWDPDLETLPPNGLRRLQQERLQQTVARAFQSPFYRQRLQEAGVTPDTIQDLEDIRKIPFTTKADLRAHSREMLTVPLKDIIRLHASSGTTGQATVVYYTRRDIELWADLVARSLYMTGMREDDVFQNMMGYGLFTGGLGFHQGASKIGATVIPTSSGQTERQVAIMQDFGTTVICCTPSYALTIAEKGQQMGVNFKNLRLRVGIFGAEPWTTEMRKEIEERLDIKAHEAYGLTELMGPGVAFDCAAQDGYLHINEDHVLAEIVDPVTGEVLPEGKRGELVFTAIQRQAMPLLRYRTGTSPA